MYRSVSPAELSKVLGVNEASIYAMMQRDHLVLRQINGRTVITEAALRDYVARKGLKMPDTLSPYKDGMNLDYPVL